MNGIFGFLGQCGANPELRLCAMADQMNAWSVAEAGYWSQTGIGLGLIEIPDDQGMSPLVEGVPGGQLVLVADVRLDNRDELYKKLDLQPETGELSDMQLILAAYRRWGEDTPTHLLGDFVFAIWDEPLEKLILARDHVGVKCLYYAQVENDVYFANHIAPLVNSGLVPDDIESDVVECYLRYGSSDLLDKTFYRLVSRLASGTLLVVDKQGFRLRRYWHPGDADMRYGGSEEECVTHLVGLMKDAVSVRVHSEHPVFSHLSGGLDSSAVAVLAARELACKGQSLLAYNWNTVVRTEGSESLEWSLADELSQRENIDQHESSIDASRLARVFADINIGFDDLVDLWYEHPARDWVRDNHGQVILSGWGGDEFISSYGTGLLCEEIMSGHIIRAYRRYEENLGDKPWKILRFARAAALSVIDRLKPAAYYRFLNIFRRPGAPSYLSIPKRICGRAVPGVERPFWKHSTRAHKLDLFDGGHIQARLQAWYSAGLEKGIEYRFPLLDKRLVEFSLAVPPALYRKGRNNRYIFRQALRGMVPDSVSQNSVKDEPLRIRHYHQLVLAALKEAVGLRKPVDSTWFNAEEFQLQLAEVELDARDNVDSLIQKTHYPVVAYLLSGVCKDGRRVTRFTGR